MLRALAAAVTAVALSVPATPAFAESSQTCPHDQSIRLLTGGTGTTENKVWVYTPSTGTTVVCFATWWPGHSGAVVIRGAAPGVPGLPGGGDPSACTTTVPVGLIDPVEVTVKYGPSVVCVSVAGTPVVLGLVPSVGVPQVDTVEVWLDSPWGEQVACEPYRSDQQAYAECVAQDSHRVV